MAWTTAKRHRTIVLLALVATAWVFSYPLNAGELEASLPNLDLILDSLERTEMQNPALSRPYELTRQYKVFRGDDTKPSSEVTAQISFTPPDIKTFKITEAQGNSRGKEIASSLLEQEIASAKEGRKGAISRSNYNFVFLREHNFGAVPEYVLHIIPKRREKGLLLGDTGLMLTPSINAYICSIVYIRHHVLTVRGAVDLSLIFCSMNGPSCNVPRGGL